MNSVFTTQMKCAVVSALISLVFVSQAFAVLRPLFPIKPTAPFNGELIVVGDDLVLRSTKKSLMHPRRRHSSQLAGPPAMASVMRAVSCVGYALAKISHARETRHRSKHTRRKGDFVEP